MSGWLADNKHVPVCRPLSLTFNIYWTPTTATKTTWAKPCPNTLHFLWIKINQDKLCATESDALSGRYYQNIHTKMPNAPRKNGCGASERVQEEFWHIN